MSRSSTLLLAALATALVGCSGEAPPPTQPDPTAWLKTHSFTAPVTQNDSLTLVLDVAKHLALSLADGQVRSELVAALKRTKVHEGKVHLQRFVQHRGAAWGELVSERNGLGKAGWKNELNLLPDLEMYLPVEAHRRKWKGTPDIVVLGEIRDEVDIRKAGGAYTAFDIHGNELHYPMNAPPERPVLSVVPVETSFAAGGESSEPVIVPMCDNTCPPPGGGGGGDAGVMTGDSLVLYKSIVDDISQYEGFGAGAPEFMILLKAYNPSAGHYSTVINCAGEGVAAPRGFNQDGNTWTGRAHMALTPLLGPYINNRRDPVFWVYENDSGQNCNFEPTEHEDIEEAVAALAAISTGIGIDKIIKAPNLANWAYTIASGVLAVVAYWHATAGDDFVGLVTVPKGLDPSMTPKRIMNEEPPTTRGYLYMQFRPK